MPNSILNLPCNCTIDLTATGLSETIISNLRRVAEAPGYNGPRFTFSMERAHGLLTARPVKESLETVYKRAGKPQPPLTQLLQSAQESGHMEHLKQWLFRLGWSAEGGSKQVHSETSKAFYQVITKNLELAEQNEDFRTSFWANVEEGCTSCGDRIALSVLKLGLVRRRLELQDQSLPEIWRCLKQAWTIDLLEQCAIQKVPSLRFFDEVEVYLGYPIRLREKLELTDLDVQEMLFFQCSALKQPDLDAAEAYVKSQWASQTATAEYFLGQPEWMAALKRTYLRTSEIIT